MNGNQNKPILTWRERNTEELRLMLAVFVFLCAFIGSIQYYTKFYDGDLTGIRLCIAVIHSTLALFVANPTVDIGEATPLTYELARFLAPLLTSYCIYKVIQETFLRYVGTLRYMFERSNEIVIFGKNVRSMELIDSIAIDNKKLSSMKKRSIVLVTKTPVEDEERLELEKKGAFIMTIDFYTKEPDGERQRAKRMNLLDKMNFEKTREIVFMDDDETYNFALFGDLLDLSDQWPEGTPYIQCSVFAENKGIRQSISNLFDRYVKAGKAGIGLNLLGVSEAEVLDMMEEHPFYEPNLKVLQKKAEEKPVGIQDVPDVHLVIAGLGTCGLMVLEKALQTAALKNPTEKNKGLWVTVIDRDRATERNMYTRFPGIENACHLHFIEQNVEREGLELKLDAINKQVTYVAICFSNQTTGYLTLDRMKKYITAENIAHKDDGKWIKDLCVPMAIRMEVNNSYLPFLVETNPDYEVFDFGNVSEIFTIENVLRNKLDKKAMDYNFRYQTVLKKIGDEYAAPTDAREEWYKLSYELRESSRAAALNAPYFHDLIKTIKADDYFTEAEIDKWDIKDNSMIYEMDGTVLDELAALEHWRWCCFYYSYGYIGACENPKDKRKFMFIETEKGRQYGQVHNCLVPYEQLKTNPDNLPTIHYDLANVYNYYGSEN